MQDYNITDMIVDDDFYGEEYVTAEFTYQQDQYSITFKKGDLELINSWVFKEGSSLPANLSESMIELIREDIKKKM